MLAVKLTRAESIGWLRRSPVGKHGAAMTVFDSKGQSCTQRPAPHTHSKHPGGPLPPKTAGQGAEAALHAINANGFSG